MGLDSRGGGQKWWRVRGVLMIALLLTIGAGFCLFDADRDGETDHAVHVDLCLAMLVAVATLTILTRLPRSGWAPMTLALHPIRLTLRTPTPPPKTASL